MKQSARFMPLLAAAGLVLTTQILSGCVAVGIGLGAGAVVAHQEERGIGGALSDTGIRLAITDLWLRQDHRLLGDLGLMIYDGRVLVTGNVDDQATMDNAISLAWQPRGVDEVINEIRINAPRGLTAVATDQVTTKKLQAQMLIDREIKTINYHRRTYDGTIYILGIAQDRLELDRVLAMARNISGVRNVVSHIELASDSLRAAQLNAPPSSAAYLDDPVLSAGSTDAYRIGQVTPVAPRGRVSVSALPQIEGSNDQRRAYAITNDGEPIPLTGEAASHEPILDFGPSDSIEMAALGKGTDPRDAEISLKINELWYDEDPEMYRRLGLLVQDARVVITGVVDDEDMRGAPYRLAWQVPGVQEVYNETRVGPDPARTQMARDRLIESEMIIALQSERSVAMHNYAIGAENGHLFILGTADSPTEMTRVEALARALDGVEKIVSHLILREEQAARRPTN